MRQWVFHYVMFCTSCKKERGIYIMERQTNEERERERETDRQTDTERERDMGERE